MQSDCKVVAFIMRKNKEDKIMCKRVYLKARKQKWKCRKHGMQRDSQVKQRSF